MNMPNNQRKVADGLIVALFGALSTVAFAQGDRSVTTERNRPAGMEETVATLAREGSLSDQPRYFLDTIDNLNRFATDETRTAPGLSKNNYVVKIYPVYNTNAIEIQSYLLRSLAYEGGTCEVMGADTVSEDGRGIQFLYVTAPDHMIPGIDDVVEMSDKEGFKFFDATGLDYGGGPGAVSYVGKHRTASELVAILAGTELGNIGAFLFPPFADDSTNTIYIVENPTDIADDIAALEMFDKPPLQVEVEVKIFEISEDDSSKLGLDWDSWKRFFSGDLTYLANVTPFNGERPLTTDNSDISVFFNLDAAAFTEFLNYTVSTGTTDLETATKITMVNSEDVPGGLSGGNRGAATGKPAVVSTMTAIPFVRTIGSNGLRSDNIEGPGEEGIKLEILPFIGTESITMDVSVTINSLVGFSAEENVPIVSERNSSSVVNLKDGEYIVLSGFKKTTLADTQTGIPGLKDIPVIKYLFSKTVKSQTTSDVLISLRPTIKTSDERQATLPSTTSGG